MGILDSLFNGAPPQNVTGSGAGTTSQPEWYQQLMQSIAGQGMGVASRGYIPYEGERQFDFTPDQQTAFGNVRNAQGAWTPGVQQAQGMVTGAVNAAGAPAQQWTNNWQQYMSPYTSGVVDEIARLGNRNLFENVMPALNDTFIGSGGFGSTRNADMIGRAIRDSQRDITGAQSAALQQGYGTSANIFGADANRLLQQQQLRAQTGLSGGAQMGALSQLGQNMGYQDANALMGTGALQQQFGQQGLDTTYNEFLNQRNYGWDTLNNLNSLVRGMQLPTTQTSTNNVPYGNVGTSPMQWINYMLGMKQAGG